MRDIVVNTSLFRDDNTSVIEQNTNMAISLLTLYGLSRQEGCLRLRQSSLVFADITVQTEAGAPIIWLAYLCVRCNNCYYWHIFDPGVITVKTTLTVVFVSQV